MDLFTFRAPPTGRSHPETSRAAAEIIAPKAPAMRNMVLRYANDCGMQGFIDEELTDYFSGYQGNSIRPRRVELKDDGLIVDSGMRRKNSRGHKCVVWISATNNGAAGRPKPKPKYGVLEHRLKTALRDLEKFAITIKRGGAWDEDHERRLVAAQKWKD